MKDSKFADAEKNHGAKKKRFKSREGFGIFSSGRRPVLPRWVFKMTPRQHLSVSSQDEDPCNAKRTVSAIGNFQGLSCQVWVLLMLMIMY